MRNFKLTTRMVIRLNRILARGIPERIICCSQSVYDIHLRSGYPHDRMTVIPNGVDCNRFQPARQQYKALRDELGIPPTARLIGYGGRWIPSKEHRILIQAAKTLVDEYTDLYFVLWGPGIDNHNEALVTMLQQYDLLNRFRLIGATSVVEKCLQGLDLYVSPSLDEALPMSVAEAMACSVPCVVTDVGDQGKLVEKTGVIVQPGSEKTLTQGIKTILMSEESQLYESGRRARQRILKHHSIDHTAKRYTQIYRELGKQ